MKIDWPLLWVRMAEKVGGKPILAALLDCDDSTVRAQSVRNGSGRNRDLTATLVLEAKRMGVEIPERK